MNELQEIRKAGKLSQVEAANILGISRRTYQKYESLTGYDRKLKLYANELKEATAISETVGVLTIGDIKEITDVIFSKYDVNFCYLFGSYAKGKAMPSSDIDLIIDADITGLDFFGIVEELREALHKKIDLLKINQLDGNQELLKEVMKDGIKIYG